MRLGHVKMGLVNIGSRNPPIVLTRRLGVRRCIILWLTGDVCCWSVWGTAMCIVSHLERCRDEGHAYTVVFESIAKIKIKRATHTFSKFTIQIVYLPRLYVLLIK